MEMFKEINIGEYAREIIELKKYDNNILFYQRIQY